MKKILFKIVIIALLLVNNTTHAGEVKIRELRSDSFFNSELAYDDHRNTQRDLQIKTNTKSIINTIDQVPVDGETIVIDSSDETPEEIIVYEQSSSVNIIGDKGYVQINNRTHQIPIRILGQQLAKQTNDLNKYEKRNIENCIADTINLYGLTPAEIQVNFKLNNYELIAFKSKLTDSTFETRHIPIRTSEYLNYNYRLYFGELDNNEN